jgi:uncharacterized membrane protein
MVVAVWIAFVALSAIGAWCARRAFAAARGLERLVALANAFFAMPLAVFGAEHLAGDEGIASLVPSYMPWRPFWLYFVGVALVAASLSIATRTLVRWSGLLFGVMMFLFVAMLHLPGALSSPHERIGWVIVLRELSFGGGGWILAGSATPGWRAPVRAVLVNTGRVLIGAAAIFYGIQHLLHPLNVPGVPLARVLPEWMPARALVGYLTGALLLVCGAGVLLGKKARELAKYLGAWIVLLVIAVYGPLLIESMRDPTTAARVQGINYFTDTLLFAAAILALPGTSGSFRPGRPAAEPVRGGAAAPPAA